MPLTKLCFRHIQYGRGILFLETKRGFKIHSRIGPTVEELAGIRKDLFHKLEMEKIRQNALYPIPAVNNSAVKRKRSSLFSEEKQRQFNEVGRIDKIDVKFVGLPENANLLMNKNVSTPYHCAQHVADFHVTQGIVAEVNGQLWDMHRPLEENCTLKLLTMRMKDEDPFQVNRVFWRSCSMMLGYVAERAFSDHIYVELHSFPSPNVRSGSFVYDIDIKIPDWRPNSDEMRAFSAELRKLSHENLLFERLEVTTELALQMFEDNKYKKQQIPEIAATSPNGNTITLYRIGDFVDISKGPMMTSTGQIGRATVTTCTLLPQCSEISPTLYRFQGVALPAGFLLNHFAWGLIEGRGRKPNPARLPGSPIVDSGHLHPNTVKNLTGSMEKEAVALG